MIQAVGTSQKAFRHLVSNIKLQTFLNTVLQHFKQEKRDENRRKKKIPLEVEERGSEII